MKAISILQPWASLCVHTDENGYEVQIIWSHNIVEQTLTAKNPNTHE